MSLDKLNQAVRLIKAGNKNDALPILRKIVQSDPNNEMAWLWLYACVNTNPQKIYCLQQALRVNPENQNAQQALAKLSDLSQQNNKERPSQAKAQNINNGQSKSFGGEIRPNRPQKSRANRTLFLFGGAFVLFLFCIGGLFWSLNWVYPNILKNVAQIETPAEPYQNNDNSEQGGISITTPEPASIDNSLPTAILTPADTGVSSLAPNLQIVPYTFTREQATGALGIIEGWDDLAITLAIENPTDNIVSVWNNAQNTVSIKTSQGYEYNCDSFIGGYPYGSEKDFIPAQGRMLYYASCQVPQPSSGFTLVINYTETLYLDNSLPPMRYVCKDFPEKCASSNFAVVINPELVNPNMTFPFLESAKSDMEKYAREHNINLAHVNQPNEVFDATIVIKPVPDSTLPEVYRVNNLFSFDATSKYLGGNTYIGISSIFYTPNGLAIDCNIDTNMGPGQSLDGFSCDLTANHTIDSMTELPIGSCLFIYKTTITVIAGQGQDYPSPILLCFN
jgi:hypothetical protein